MSSYCPDCGKVIIHGTYVSHDDVCRCGEFFTYSPSDSSCIEKTLHAKLALEEVRLYPPGSYITASSSEIERYSRTLRWKGQVNNLAHMIIHSTYGRYYFEIQSGILYIFDNSQDGQIIEECWEPRIFGQILRKYIDQVDYESSSCTLTVSGDKK